MTNTNRVFLAHASEDKILVYELYNKLKSQGFMPWLDKVDIIPGQNWKLEIPKAIEESKIFIACLSNRSIRKQGYIQKEFRLALDVYVQKLPESIYLIPIKLDECEVPDIQNLGISLRDIQWLDYFQPDGFTKLTKTIEYVLGYSDQNNINLSADYQQSQTNIKVTVISKQSLSRKLRVYFNETTAVIKFQIDYSSFAINEYISVWVNDEIAYKGTHKRIVNFVIPLYNQQIPARIDFELNEPAGLFLPKLKNFYLIINDVTVYSE